MEEKSYDLQRFVEAHERMFNTALYEVRNGKKQSHWMWYIFPQLKGLGRKARAYYYGIEDLDEAIHYLDNPTLNQNMKEIVSALLTINSTDPITIFGHIDAMKLRSSMTLFDLVEPNSIFANVLTKYFNGKHCHLTLELLNLAQS